MIPDGNLATEAITGEIKETNIENYKITKQYQIIGLLTQH